MKPYWKRQEAIEKLETEVEELRDKIGWRKMKAILEFNLPEDEEQFNTANKGMEWALVAWDIDQLLRNKLKYSDLLPNTRAELEEIRDTLNEMLVDRGLNYPE